MNFDTDACEQCSMQIHRLCMSEFENVCMNCQMVEDQSDPETNVNMVSTQTTFESNQGEHETSCSLVNSTMINSQSAEENSNGQMNATRLKLQTDSDT